MSTPFSNCQFKICDLEGQCIGEGRCHHPKRLTEDDANTVKDLQQRLSLSQLNEARLREALGLILDSYKEFEELNPELKTPAEILIMRQALSTPLTTADLERFVSESVESEIKKFASEVKGLCQDFNNMSGNVYILDVKGAIDGLVELYAKKG